MRNPATGEVITTVAEATGADVDAAVTAARQAFDSGPWPRLPARERARVLTKAAGLLAARAEEFAQLESVDAGKPITFSRMIDVGTTIEHFEYYAALAHTWEGSVRAVKFPAHAYTRREPLGVVAAITPFNFPLILSITKIAPALACGNTVIHKPAETPLTALRIADLLAEAGVPAGVFNVVTGPGGDRRGPRRPPRRRQDRLHRVDRDRPAGRRRGSRRLTRTVELGGKSANIVFADADLDAAVQAAVFAFCFNTGQFCMAGAGCWSSARCTRRSWPGSSGARRTSRSGIRSPSPRSSGR